MIIERDALLKLLRAGYVDLRFTKVDGRVRDMRATLLPDLIPTEVLESVHSTKPQNDDVVTVWDAVFAGWRTVRLDSILHYDY